MPHLSAQAGAGFYVAHMFVHAGDGGTCANSLTRHPHATMYLEAGCGILHPFLAPCPCANIPAGETA